MHVLFIIIFLTKVSLTDFQSHGRNRTVARQKAFAGAVNSCSNLPFVCLGGKWWEHLARDEVQQKSTQALT